MLNIRKRTKEAATMRVGAKKAVTWLDVFKATKKKLLRLSF